MKKNLGYSNLVVLKETNMENLGDLIFFNELVDLEDFWKRLEEFWDKQTEKGDYEFDDMYSFILKNWKVKEIIYLDNLKKVYY